MRKTGKTVPLPPLAFGEKQAFCTTDPTYAEEQTAKALTSLNYIRPLSEGDPFYNKAATATVNGLTLVATSSVAVRIDVGATDDFHLIIPFAGRSTLYADSKKYEWAGGEQAVLFAESNRRKGVGEARSLLMAHLDKTILSATTAAMMGEQESALRPDGESVRLLELNFAGVNFLALFDQLCRELDLLSGNETTLKTLRIDDQFYRLAAMMMNPANFFDDAGQENGSIGASTLDLVCDAARNASSRALSLTEMESISGLSARALQYAFQKRFGQSPTQWQQNERLHLARDRLMKNKIDASITDLALELGFSSHSRFSAFYRRKFGETPSATLENARRRRHAKN